MPLTLTVVFDSRDGREPLMGGGACVAASARLSPSEWAIESGATRPWVEGVLLRAAALEVSSPVAKGARGATVAMYSSGWLAKASGVEGSEKTRGKLKATSVPSSLTDETTSLVAAAGASVRRSKVSVGMS